MHVLGYYIFLIYPYSTPVLVSFLFTKICLSFSFYENWFLDIKIITSYANKIQCRKSFGLQSRSKYFFCVCVVAFALHCFVNIVHSSMYSFKNIKKSYLSRHIYNKPCIHYIRDILILLFLPFNFKSILCFILYIYLYIGLDDHQYKK